MNYEINRLSGINFCFVTLDSAILLLFSALSAKFHTEILASTASPNEIQYNLN